MTPHWQGCELSPPTSTGAGTAWQGAPGREQSVTESQSLLARPAARTKDTKARQLHRGLTDQAIGSVSHLVLVFEARDGCHSSLRTAASFSSVSHSFFSSSSAGVVGGGLTIGLSHRIEVQRAEQDVPFHLLAVWTSATSIVDNHQFTNGRC